MTSRTALLWLTHLWDPELEAEFETVRRLDEGAAAPADVWLLLDSRTPGAAALARRYARCHVFEEDRLFGLPYRRLAGHGLIAHFHYPLLEFFLTGAGYDTYWVVEYDVRFTGSWASLLGAFRGFDHDLITSHVRRFAQEPSWPWWDSLDHPTKTISRDRYVRSFNVIYRISHRALRFLHEAHVDGWRGFPEVSFPTLLLDGGLRVLDFGGDGEFAPPGYRNRFYTSRGASTGHLSPFGTIRYRPSRARPGRRPNMLYHPVKPRSRMEPPMQKMRIVSQLAAAFLRDYVR